MKRLMIATLLLCSSCSDQDTGKTSELSSLVDRIKEFLGFKEKPGLHTSAHVHTHRIAEQQTTIAQDNPSNTKVMNLEDNLVAYRKYENELLDKEDDIVKAIEDETNKKIEEIMLDKRVVKLLEDDPELNFEDLPEDIYNKILKVINEQENLVNAAMDETDEKLLSKAVSLGVYEHLSKETKVREEEKQKRIIDLKEKVAKNPQGIATER